MPMSLRLLDINLQSVRGMAREFIDAAGIPGAYSLDLIYMSADYPRARQVFKVSAKNQDYALKLDYDSPQTGRLEKDFNVLSEVHGHFSAYERVATPKPLYLSADKRFFVTELVGRRTASHVIQKSTNDASVAQVFRRAGHWLHVLHAKSAPQTTGFWPNWMIEAIDVALAEQPVQADPEEYAPMIEMLKRDSEALTGTIDLKVFGHGDFHGSNLILGNGVTYGLDFTESSSKLAVYDIVDFLKADIFRTVRPRDIDRSGLSRHNKSMFFKLYRHRVNPELLDVCIRGRLLIDWLTISRARYAASAFQRKKFTRLRERLLASMAQG
ncbi:phosphotransferase [Tropicimonas marinistellae]|uniref:phosphotransferase n=1 Tax=Tropicimonas marinistellae TaxID=1739787 RepID=UPI000835439B|nr:phosphotransferase [Tropicimonas marinistellae]